MEAERRRDDAGNEGGREKGNKNLFERIVEKHENEDSTQDGRLEGSKGKRWMEKVWTSGELVMEK